METLATVLICYIGFGALICSARPSEWTAAGQWELFRDTFRDVLVWPAALWREFGSF